MRRIGMVGAYSIIGVMLITAATVILLPSATVRSVFTGSDVPAPLLNEPADRIALISWWLFAAVLANVMLFRIRRGRGRRSKGTAWHSDLNLAIGVAAIVICIAAITWQNDVAKVWPGIPAVGIILGLGLAALILWLMRAPRPATLPAAVLLVGTSLAYSFPAWLQVPGAVRDPFHFQFTSDEVAAVAAGHFPLFDYVPQYSTLLGFPIAPLLKAAPSQASLICLGWFLLLELVAIAIAIALPVLQAGRRMIAPAVLVVLAPTLTTTLLGISASTYFSVLPMRVILPLLTILVAYLALRRRPSVSFRQPLRWLVLGLAAGTAALNNPDYGLPVVLTVVVVLLIAVEGVPARIISTAVVLVSTSLPFLAYWLLSIAVGRPVDWSQWLLFSRLFGVSGFAEASMTMFGLHVAVISLFVAASAIGFILVRNARPAVSSFAYRQGLLLTLTGGWSLLTLPYFAGRSLAPTLIVGSAFLVGLVTASFLPLIDKSLRAYRCSVSDRQSHATVGLSMGVLAIAGSVSAFSLFWAPSQYLSPMRVDAPLAYAPLTNQSNALRAVIGDAANLHLKRLIDGKKVEQALPFSGLTAIVDRLPSGAVVSNPTYYTFDPFGNEFTSLQCTSPGEHGLDYLLVLPESADQLKLDPLCRAAFDFSQEVVYSSGADKFALLRRVA